ncbi:YhcN/YlaJ family sporulation lipoprotein [Paenibacillus sp. MWE-103]|uniref:YhcN/YlaJ family sporulation lipoprotein n=1 Tax=Paenibacillus artemisiicola TaxID=1172618 RepID=A0ABS3W928_9BACL|nr:YhcN/YlaJ family sporulation lipoprotein [Paenibacillus artemisiicola]MBO7744825.1 YhcN/YlaJ family sporulation lipoprotein [Paenibacillus artemisiicola]
MQHRKWAMLAAGAMLSTVLTGCMEKHGELGNRNIRGNSVSYDMNGNRILNTRFANDQMNEMNRVDGHRLNSNNLVGLHKNYRMEMSEAMGERISGIKGVGKAYVMLTDNNAYVAVRLNRGAGAGKGTAGAPVHQSGTSSMSLGSAKALSRTQQAYLRPHTMRSMNAHALDRGKGVHRMTRASSIATPNMHLSGTKNTYGMNGMMGTSGNYGMNGMYGTSGTAMYGKAANKMKGLANGRSSSSFHNVSHGVRNMSLSLNTNSYLRGPSYNYVNSNRNNINGLTNHYQSGLTNQSRNTARDLTNLAAPNALPRAMSKGTNALYRGSYDVARGTGNVGRDIAGGVTGLARGTGNLLRNTANLPADVAKGTPSPLGRDLARDTGIVGRDIGRGAMDIGRTVGRGAADVTYGAGNAVGNVARGTGNAIGDVARGTGNAIGDVARGTGNAIGNVARGTGNAITDVARSTGNPITDVARGTGNAMTDLAQGAGNVINDVTRGTANVANDLTRGTSRGYTNFADGRTGSVAPFSAERMMAESDVSAALRAQIAQEIKKMSPSIKEVYVSANSEFVDRMAAYEADYKNGQPIQGYIAEFNAMVDRIFPARYISGHARR